MWKGPHHGFVKRLLTHQHCAHRCRNQNWVVNPEWKRQNPGSGWVRNHADSKKGGGGVNVRDKTCSKNRDTEKNKVAASLGISIPLESGQLESWYFHLGASNGISVTSPFDSSWKSEMDLNQLNPIFWKERERNVLNLILETKSSGNDSTRIWKKNCWSDIICSTTNKSWLFTWTIHSDWSFALSQFESCDWWQCGNCAIWKRRFVKSMKIQRTQSVDWTNFTLSRWQKVHQSIGEGDATWEYQ